MKNTLAVCMLTIAFILLVFVMKEFYVFWTSPLEQSMIKAMLTLPPENFTIDFNEEEKVELPRAMFLIAGKFLVIIALCAMATIINTLVRSAVRLLNVNFSKKVQELINKDSDQNSSHLNNDLGNNDDKYRGYK